MSGDVQPVHDTTPPLLCEQRSPREGQAYRISRDPIHSHSTDSHSVELQPAGGRNGAHQILSGDGGQNTLTVVDSVVLFPAVLSGPRRPHRHVQGSEVIPQRRVAKQNRQPGLF